MTEDKCIICGKKCFSNGVGMTLYSISESGKIQDMNETKHSSMQVIVPLCAYHMVLTGEGVGLFTTQKTYITRAKTDYYEKKSDEELKEIIENSLKHFKLTRKKVENQHMMSELKIAVIIDNARNFSKGMEDAQK